jgi:hypothetical protein
MKETSSRRRAAPGPRFVGPDQLTRDELRRLAKAELGPVGVAITPSGIDAIDKIRDGLKAELDSLALELKAQLAGGAPAQA